MKKIIYPMLIVSSISMTLRAQKEPASKDYPVVGEVCPDIIFRNLNYLPNVSTLKDLRNKWVILDFWTKGCSGCVATFPKLNAIQKEFSDNAQIILIGNNDRRNRGIDVMYEKFRMKQDLKIAVAFDSTLFERFGITSVPHVVIVAPSGIVHAVTYADGISVTSIRSMIEGKPSSFTRKNSTHEESVNASQSPVENRNKDQILSGSILSKWSIGQKVSKQLLINNLTSAHTFDVKGVSLEELYKYAYVGYIEWALVDSLYDKWHRDIILESQDQSPNRYDYEKGTGLFNYFLKPGRKHMSMAELKIILREDLLVQFGYKVTIEERDFPVWILSATDSARIHLKSRHSTYRYLGDHAGRQFENASIKIILETIRDYNYKVPPMIDNSGIVWNIDLSIDALMTDFDAVRKNLSKVGLNFTKGFKKMKVIVLRDPVNP